MASGSRAGGTKGRLDRLDERLGRLEGHLESLLDAMLDGNAAVVPRCPKCQNCSSHGDNGNRFHEVGASLSPRAPGVLRSKHRPKARRTMDSKRWRAEMRKRFHREPWREEARDARETQEESLQSVGSPSMMEYYPTPGPHLTWEGVRFDFLVSEDDDDAEYTPRPYPLQAVVEQAGSN